MSQDRALNGPSAVMLTLKATMERIMHELNMRTKRSRSGKTNMTTMKNANGARGRQDTTLTKKWRIFRYSGMASARQSFADIIGTRDAAEEPVASFGIPLHI